MGCDIHVMLEEKDADTGKWININTFPSHHMQYADKDAMMDGYSMPVAESRNYQRFGALAGVRCDGPNPRGLPDNISETTAFMANKIGQDGHSHSWLPFKDAVKIWKDTEYKELSDNTKKYPASYFFTVDDIEEDKDWDRYRVVFWFDN